MRDESIYLPLRCPHPRPPGEQKTANLVIHYSHLSVEFHSQLRLKSQNRTEKGFTRVPFKAKPGISDNLSDKTSKQTPILASGYAGVDIRMHCM